MNRSQQTEKKKTICLAGCRYDIVFQIAHECGFVLVPEQGMWQLNWSDVPLSPEKIMEVRRLQNANAMTGEGGHPPPMQKMNHFPGMYEISRKDRLGRNLNKMKRLFSEEYNFFPSTWDLPSDMSDLMSYWRRNKNATFIIKPESGCQGKGIFLVRNPKLLCPFAKCVCQLYLSQPFLIDGYKFDQRIYVLITCVDPLRIYIYNEGLARFATVKYSMPSDQNLDVVYMHLTNYSLNKFSASYDPQGGGSKRKMSSVYKWMSENGYDVKQLTDSIDDIIIKTIICASPTLRHNYRTSFPRREYGCSCFEVLGFDIMVDRHMKPMLVEVNHSPSFNLDLPVDREIKSNLVRDVISMIYRSESQIKLGTSDYMQSLKKSKLPKSPAPLPRPRYLPQQLIDQFAHEDKNKGNFRLIFTEQNPGKYARFMEQEFSLATARERSYLKKRLEPIYSDISGGFEPPRIRTTRKQTKHGQLYVETKPVTPDILDPEAYMMFKCSAETSQNSAKYSDTSNKTRTSTKSSKSSSSKRSSDGNSAKDKTDAETNFKFDQGASSGDVNGNTSCSNPYPILSPSQRVRIALEKLRQKNDQKFRLTTKLNDGILRSSGGKYSDISPYLVDALQLCERKSKKKVKTPLDISNNEISIRSPATVSDLDSSKLPSVCGPYLKTSDKTQKSENRIQKFDKSDEIVDNNLENGSNELTKHEGSMTDINNNSDVNNTNGTQENSDGKCSSSDLVV